MRYDLNLLEHSSLTSAYMRLSLSQIQTIKKLVTSYCGEDAKIWLFGSRTDDSARGGDIDLYVEVGRPLPERWETENRLLIELWKALGEQKIDLILSDPTAEPRPIHEIARKTGLLLQ